MSLSQMPLLALIVASVLAVLQPPVVGPPASTAAPAKKAGPQVNSPPKKVAAEHLPNPWRIHPKVISGGLPEGDAAFKELADLGVKTIISVDGAKPDVATAKKYGLRY